MKNYDSKKIEPKWQKKWKSQGLYKAEDFDKDKEKFYCLVEFPYPSGEGLHIGHAFTMTGADVYARKKRMDGYNVLFPMGYDAFGLPAENYAIKMGIHPSVAVKQNTETFRRQMEELAFSFDWDREVNTTDPDYYRWTQWIFVKLFEKGLAYKEEKPINWCPSCKIGLANEEVVDGKCERCGAEATKKNLSQWIVKITDYADRLIDGLEQTDFVKKVEMAQVNWIDRKQWIDINYPIKGTDREIVVSTTRPDTNFGSTFVVLAPEHPLVSEITNPDSDLHKEVDISDETVKKVKDYVVETKKKSEVERMVIDRKKTGVFTELYAVNRIDGREMPVYVTDFVLSTIGTGAVVGVPGHDMRDFEFAQKFDLPVMRVVVGSDGDTSPVTKRGQVQEEDGKMINSGFLDGMDIHKATEKMMDYIEKKGWGKRTIRYHLRDWIFSRQHYWGEPIPMVNCEKCGWVPVPEDQLPVVLPQVEKYEPTDTGESPLAVMTDWVNTECPKCGGPAKRETDTMPNWAGSDWYFLRYLDNQNDKELADMKKMEYWMPVDVYLGGDEHNTLHLLYSRFIYQFLWDIGAVPKSIPEPYYRRVSHGVILGPDGQRMSKSRGNVIVPDDMAKEYGVDVLRTYMMFMGPFEGTMAWNDNALKGVQRFVNRFNTYIQGAADKSDKGVEVAVSKLVRKVSDDLDSFQYNTAIAAMMETLNEIEGKKISKKNAKVMVQIFAPFAPYLTEELWEILGCKGSVHVTSWPKVDESVLADEEIEIPIQINGKVRGTVKVSPDVSEKAVREAAMAVENVKKHVEGKDIKKFIYVPGRIVTIVSP
ncbi:leucine--tRNA ligase [Candidatus Dojkabacteria bacterium]|nr:leucine--tRNA ligase [Candidatus Dojkabacteria bacterium]